VVYERLSIRTSGQGLYEITREVQGVVERSRAATGLCTIYLPHTSASLLVQENADSSVRADLERFLARLVPEGEELYTHTIEGPDDMPAHIRAALTATSLSIPVIEGKLALGTWQGIFLWEHRRRHQTRSCVVYVG
jgi:secondary thiamine-phosphate synthase enzyme